MRRRGRDAAGSDLDRRASEGARAAAIAGILFAVLLITTSCPGGVPSLRPAGGGSWLHTRANTVALALNLVPLAGIAFLWFSGVLRDRLGEREDRFFATVFLGGGLLFLAMLFFSITYEIMMVGVFIVATLTLALRTGFIARWVAFAGYGLALPLLLSSRKIEGILMAVPLWVLVVSLHILVGNLREPSQTRAPAQSKDIF